MWMALFHRDASICFLLYDVFDDFCLTAHRINVHHSPGKINKFQQFRNGDDFVAAGINGKSPQTDVIQRCRHISNSREFAATQVALNRWYDGMAALKLRDRARHGFCFADHFATAGKSFATLITAHSVITRVSVDS